MDIEEEIEREKIARKWELFRNDLIIFIIIFVLILSYSSNLTNLPFSYLALYFGFGLTLFFKQLICSFIFNVQHNTKFLLFAPTLFYQSGENINWVLHFFKTIFWVFGKAKNTERPLIRKMKIISNFLFIAAVVLRILIYIYSKEIF